MFNQPCVCLTKETKPKTLQTGLVVKLQGLMLTLMRTITHHEEFCTFGPIYIPVSKKFFCLNKKKKKQS